MTTTAKPAAGRAQLAKGSGGLMLTALYLGGMLLLYIGERLVIDSAGLRIGLAALALAGIAVAIAGRVKRAAAYDGPARAVEKRILLCYLVGLLALLLYAAQADFVMERLRPMFSDSRAADRYADALAALWPVLWVCSTLPLVLIEISYAPMGLARTVELLRIRLSLSSGLVLAMSLCLVFAVNFVSDAYNEKIDLSYFKTTRPSESSKKMVANLTEPMRAVLFFPGANDVQQRVVSFFEDLKSASPNFKVEVADHALQPKLAKEMSVTDNGVVVLKRGLRSEQLRIGTELSRAKGTLKKLDAEFQNVFLKASRSQKIAYLTVGHEERTNSDRDNVKGTGISDLRTLLTKLHYKVKDLGVGQGLGNEVPKDASVVIIAGPQKEFLPSEIAALKSYLRGGGRVLAFLDPEAGWDAAPLLSPFGLKFTPAELANDRYHARVTYTKADRRVVFSIRFSAHPSVRTLSRNAPKLATVMMGAGALEQIPSSEGLKPRVQYTIHSMPLTWNDANLNNEFDKDGEKRKVYELAAAVSMKPDARAAIKKGSADENEMRLLVVGDSDLITDRVIRNPGNGYMFVDAIKWLGGEEKFIGEVSSEEDVPISHTREKDQVWFYLTIFAVPALVLGVGTFYTRRRRKR